MATHRIISVTRNAQHGHIETVTYRKDTGKNLQTKKVSSVKTVRELIGLQDRFYTFGPMSLKNALVEPWSERLPAGRTVDTIRSTGDKTTDNNLDDM